MDTLRSAVAHPADAAQGALTQAHSEVDALRADPSRFIGNAIGQAGAGAIVGGAAFEAAPRIPEAVGSVGDSVAAAKAKLYPTSQSLTPQVSAARNLSKALVVDPAGVNNFVKAATDEAGTIVGYAKDNGLPINSKIDFANAAKQAADAVQTHFDEKILAPNAQKVTAVPASYQGPTVGEGNNATLGDINSRINAISSELKSNFRKPLQAQTSAANTSDADLLSEKQALTNVLHKQLGEATGLPAQAISDLRTQAGKLRTVADESQASANRDLTAAGKQAMGTTTSAVGTKAGLIDRGLQMVQGGPEVIGNRQVNSALQKIQPTPLNLPQPSPVEVAPAAPVTIKGGPSTTITGPDYTPDPNAADIMRARIAARRPAPVDTPAKPITQMQKWANDGAVKIGAEGIADSDVTKLASVPAGRQFLIKASSLPAGSAAMKNLVLQAKQFLATGEADYR
ncbi:hypothetical protein P8936_16540 [Edaphobacter paludis]|uniref:Uncharacterized protein n=1 Tax=Edaphobacter paludis TaxID=3035702 RepID=A0AAU7D7E2_9BACT